jgi:hypothetical protein
VTVGPQEQKVLFEVRRNLTQLGIETRFTARGDALRGGLSLVAPGLVLANPLGGLPIEQIEFSVSGDGLLRIEEPAALRGLAGPHAAKVRSLEALAEGVRDALDERAAWLRGQAVRLRTFDLPVGFSTDGLGLMTLVDLEQLGDAVLKSDGQRFVASELIDSSGKNRIPFGDLEIDLDSFDDRVDLELFLSSHAERLVPDLTAKLVVSGHLAGPSETILDLTDSDEMRALVSGLLPPSAGESWVMDVRVESDDGEEVRYRGVNIAGQVFGAPRVLPKIAFEGAYTASAGGYRMLVRVVDVDDENVGYVKLDANRDPAGPTRKVSVVGFLANFRAETAAY